MTNLGNLFDDLEGNIDADTRTPNALTAAANAARKQTRAAAKDAADRGSDIGAGTTKYRETCPRCGGSGRYNAPSSYGHRCFECDGAGFKEYAQSPETRAKNRAKYAANKAKAAQEIADAFAAFEDEHPRIAAWWAATDFEFAISLREGCRKFGSLTEKQLAAAYNCVNKLAAAKAAAAERKAAAIANAPKVSVEPLVAALNKAKASGLKRPKFLVMGGADGLEFSLAPDYGRNAGAVYVKDGDTYLGKIVTGAFHASRDCSEAAKGDVLKACINPLEAAILYGKQTGVCSCCGRELTNPESIELGIGPICRAKYF